MIDTFSATTETLTKMIPVAATAGILHGATKRRRVTTRRKPSKGVKRVKPRRLTRAKPLKRTRRRGR